MASFLSKLCTPAFVYFVIGIISVLVALAYGLGFFSILAKIVLILIWTWFLNYLCIKNLVGLSWFLVILPYAFLLVAVLLAMDVLEMQNKSKNISYVSKAGKPIIENATGKKSKHKYNKPKHN
jgi:hypothetical protein